MARTIATQFEATPAAMQVLQLANGLIIHHCLHAVASLGIADLLKDGPRITTELASELGVSEDVLYRILRFLGGQGVFQEIGCRKFANNPASECLRTDAYPSLRSFLMFRGGPYTAAAFGEFLFCLETGLPGGEKGLGVGLFEHLRRNPDEARFFDDAMTNLTALWAPKIATAYDFGSWGSIMDVGGGSGVLLAEILKVHSELHGVLAEQPHVLERVHERALLPGHLASRVRFEQCDFFATIPSGSRAYLMKMVLHDWDDQRARRILVNCRRVVPENGALLLVEYRLAAANKPSVGKAVDIFMLAVTGGKERTLEEHQELLRSAGFDLNRMIPVSDDIMILEALPV